MNRSLEPGSPSYLTGCAVGAVENSHARSRGPESEDALPSPRTVEAGGETSRRRPDSAQARIAFATATMYRVSTRLELSE